MAMTGERADLHAHTTASDGMFAPADVVRKAKAAGLAALAITDHDTVAGVDEAVSEGRRCGIEVVPGAELSTSAEGGDIHILAYYTDNDNPLWQERLASQRDVRGARNERILAKLGSLGIAVEMEEVAAAASGDSIRSSIGRPHIAEVLVRKGVASSIREAFDRYLASGAAAYVDQVRIHPLEALRWIREAGGVSVIAHPGLYGNDRLVEQLLAEGADGIEVFHSDHGAEEERRYAEMAERYGCLATGGSDFHGERDGTSFHGALGSRSVALATARRLRELAATRRRA